MGKYVYTPIDNPNALSKTFNLTYTNSNILNPVNQYVLKNSYGTVISSAQFPALNTPTVITGSGTLNGAYDGIIKSNGGLYVTSYLNNMLYYVKDGSITQVTTTGVTLNGPRDIDVDNAGNLYIANSNSNNIIKLVFDPNSPTILDGSIFIINVTQATEIYILENIANNKLYVLHSRNLSSYNLSNGLLISSSFATGLGPYNGIAYHNRFFYISNRTVGNFKIDIISLDGSQKGLVTFAGSNPLVYPNYVDFDNNGNLYVSNDTSNGTTTLSDGFILRIVLSTPDINNNRMGTFTKIIDNLHNPGGVIADYDNDNGNIYVVCFGSNEIRKYSYSLDFTNIPTNTLQYGSNNTLSLYNTTGALSDNNIRILVSCYIEGTKILCLENEKEVYLPIETLTKNLLVKTYLHGYKKILHIGKGHLRNDCKKWTDCVYKMNKTDNMLDDLFVTGYHSILEDNMSDNELAKHNKLNIFNKNLNMVDDKFIQLTDTNIYTYYHFALESNDKYQQYGVYANGVLSESTSIHNYKTENFIDLHDTFI